MDHRGEYSETCGFRIKGLIFIPDIDNSENIPIKELVTKNDFLILEATFYSNNEINLRNMKEIPHRFVEDSLKLFDSTFIQEARVKYFFLI